ncbi:MAG: alpha/beta hydrolase [Patescibacteria group bacterium]
MVTHCKSLANLGFYAVSIDPPGSWDSPGDISLYTVTIYAKCVEELIEIFGNKPTFLLGHSLGGTISAIVGIRNDCVKAFAMIMSPYTFVGEEKSPKSHIWKQKGFADSKREIPNTNPIEWKYYKLPYSYLLDKLNYDLTDDLARCKKPKLFIYGEKDESITPYIVKKEYEIAAEPKTIFGVNCKHGYRRDQEALSCVNTKIVEFTKYLEDENTI